MASSILFGIGHIFLGVRNVRGTTIGVLFFAALVLLAGSLLPAMMVHVALDSHAFDLGYRAQREAGEPGTSPAVPAVL